MRPSFSVALILVAGCAAPMSETPLGVDHRPYPAKPAYLSVPPGVGAARLTELERQMKAGRSGSPLQTSTGGGSFTVAMPDPAPLANRIDTPPQPWQPQVIAVPINTPGAALPAQSMPVRSNPVQAAPSQDGQSVTQLPAVTQPQPAPPPPSVTQPAPAPQPTPQRPTPTQPTPAPVTP